MGVMKKTIVQQISKTAVVVFTLSLTVICVGCASSKVKLISSAPEEMVQPDFIIVNDFVVSPKNVKVDDGLVAEIERNSKSVSLKKEEKEIGHAMAAALTNSIIKYLKMGGVRAVKDKNGVKPTPKSLVIRGKFYRIDRGNQTMRVLVGFGFGNGTMKAMVDCLQDNKVIASGVVTTLGSYKPGIIVPVAGGAAAGTLVVSSAVAGSTATLGEAFLATIKADADRAGKEIARKIIQSYINHGWLKPDAINHLDAIF